MNTFIKRYRFHRDILSDSIIKRIKMRKDLTKTDVEYPKIPVHKIGIDRRNATERSDSFFDAPKILAYEKYKTERMSMITNGIFCASSSIFIPVTFATIEPKSHRPKG